MFTGRGKAAEERTGQLVRKYFLRKFSQLDLHAQHTIEACKITIIISLSVNKRNNIDNVPVNFRHWIKIEHYQIRRSGSLSTFDNEITIFPFSAKLNFY